MMVTAVGAVLVLFALIALVVGLISIVKPILGVRTRGRAVLVVLASFVIMIVGGTLLPPPPPSDRRQQSEATATSSPLDTGRPGAASDTRPSVETISATALIAAFEANEIAANQRFERKRIIVVGNILDIGEELLGRPYVTMGPQNTVFGVQAVFPRERDSVVATFSKGQFISVLCECKGKLLHVQLDDCALQ